MKNFKILFVLLGITAITSYCDVFAYFSIDKFNNTAVPNHNGEINRVKSLEEYQMGYDRQAIDGVTITPAKDTLDVKLQKQDSDFTITTDWKILENGYTTILTDDPRMTFQGGTFTLTIDSRWYYTKDTIINTGDWKLVNLIEFPSDTKFHF